MPFNNIADLQQRAILTAALDEFCRIGNIKMGTAEYEEAGLLIQSLYHKGATTAEALAAAIERALQGEEEPQMPLRTTASGFQPSA
jgi:hypothetical protein